MVCFIDATCSNLMLFPTHLQAEINFQEMIALNLKKNKN